MNKRPESQPLVLCVDDEAGLLQVLRLELSSQGFGVITCADPAKAPRIFEERRPDLVLLDVMMPGMNGFELMRELREVARVPIIMVTAKDRDADKVRGLEFGADDYIVKPFSVEELGARVRAVLRRFHSNDASDERIVKAGHVAVDLGRRVVLRDGENVSLTRTEWLLLMHLAANPNKVILNAELLSKVWGPEYRDDLQYLRVWVSRLRQKLEIDRSKPGIIRTMPGVGYLFVADEPDEKGMEQADDKQLAGVS
jgi:two-component system KDP operon response regulator KdpE